MVLELKQKFRMFTPSGVPLLLCSLGPEIYGDYLLLHQEVAAPKALGQYVVSSHLLQDTFSDHIHTVSVELLTPPQLLRLTASTPLGSFLLR
jgi:hypothetical protein